MPGPDLFHPLVAWDSSRWTTLNHSTLTFTRRVLFSQLQSKFLRTRIRPFAFLSSAVLVPEFVVGCVPADR